MNIRKFLSILCAMVMLVSTTSASAMTTVDKESNYNAAVLQLETYLQSFGNNSAALAGIASTFKELEGYGQSLYFGYYVTVLQKIADENYDFLMGTYLDMMEANTEFNAYLQDVLKGSPIGTVDKLKAYAQGRECEHNGEKEKAAEYFHECLSFCDASQRYMELIEGSYQAIYENALGLLNRGDFAGAYFQFASIPSYSDSKKFMASIISQLGYTPVSPDDTLKPVTNLKVKATHKDSITLSWTASPHAKAYDVYYKQSGNPGWIHAGTTDNTEITINQLSAKVAYDFRVIATIGKISAAETVLQNQKIVTLTVGDYVKFGSYPQTSSGTDSTPIEWLVLEVQDNKALLISRYILDCKSYNDYYANVTWETCTLRAWLNGTFLNRAFTAKEQQAILTTLVDNSEKQGFGEYQTKAGNVTYQTKAGNATKDKLFLLSIAEVFRYFPDEETRRCAVTDYAIQQGCFKDSYYHADGHPSGWWWLRSPLSSGYLIRNVDSAGWVSGNNVGYDYGARPALWINLDAGIF